MGQCDPVGSIFDRYRQSLQHFDLFGTRLGSAGVSPPMTLIGVTRLAIVSLMVEIEATAAD